VRAVQQPVVTAIRRLGAKDERRRILEGLREILFVWQDAVWPPYRVEMWVLANNSSGSERSPHGQAGET